ncbi:MAG: VWA domain-containing protein [Actinomycetota bacterium]
MTADGEIAARNVVVFVRRLRAEGFAVSPQTTRHIIDAVTIVGMDNMSDVRAACTAVVVTRQNQVERFNELFDEFFSGAFVVSLDSVVDRIAQTRRSGGPSRIGATATDDTSGIDETEETFEVMGGSHSERLMDVDFSDLDEDEAAAVAVMLDSMTWSPTSVRSRRWRPSTNGPTPDLRRTMRLVTGPQGDLMPLAFTERRRKQRPLIVLADISGSMERYSEMLLHFIHGAQHRFQGVESFVFATRLTRITRQLRVRNPTEAITSATKAVPDWSGGTRIGEAIGTYNHRWSRRVGGGGPIVLIISDGWDTGDPDYLAVEMRRLGRAAHRVVWLNPLAGRTGFAPEARGMAAALPHVDDLLAGGTARNLADLIDLLQSAGTTGRSAAAL